MTVSELLDAAADLIERSGWTQKTSARDADGTPCALNQGVAFCPIGAIDWADWVADHDWSLVFDAFSALADAIGGGQVAVWNDAPDRTQDDVVTALRTAAKATR